MRNVGPDEGHELDTRPDVQVSLRRFEPPRVLPRLHYLSPATI